MVCPDISLYIGSLFYVYEDILDASGNNNWYAVSTTRGLDINNNKGSSVVRVYLRT